MIDNEDTEGMGVDVDPENAQGDIEDAKPQKKSIQSKDNPLTFEHMKKGLSRLEQIGYGHQHAYVKFDCVERGITNIDLLATYIHLRFVRLSSNSLSDIAQLTCCRFLHKIDVDNNVITFAGQLGPLPYLQSLNMSSNKINECGEITQPVLRHFNLNHNVIESLLEADRPIFSKALLPCLQVLELRGNRLKSTLGIAGLPHLQELYLAQNLLTHLDDIYNLGALRILHLRDNQLSKLDGFSASMERLTYLNLRNNRIKLWKEVKKLAVLPSLKALKLSENPIEEKDNYRLMVVGTLPLLDKLDKERITKSERREAVEILASAAVEEQDDEETTHEQEKDPEKEGDDEETAE